MILIIGPTRFIMGAYRRRYPAFKNGRYAASYAAYVATTWCRYERVTRQSGGEDRDALLTYGEFDLQEVTYTVRR